MCKYDDGENPYRFDAEGYDAEGFDAKGRNHEGLCRDGFDRHGYSASTGQNSRYHNENWWNGEPLLIEEWGYGDFLVSQRNVGCEDERYGWRSLVLPDKENFGWETQEEAKHDFIFRYEQYVEEVAEKLQALVDGRSTVIA